jgi:hypothetical protein
MSTTPVADEGPRPAQTTAQKSLFDPDLKALLDRPLLPHETFLSLYLDASVDAQGKRHHDVFLEKRLHTARERLARLPVDLRGYDRLAERIRAYTAEADKSGVAGFAIFAELPPPGGVPGGGEPFFEAFRLPVRVENRFILGREPDLGPILRAIGSYAHYLAVRVDADDALILSVWLSKVRHEERGRAEGTDQSTWGKIRVQAGGWSQMRVQRKKEEHAQRFFRGVAERVREIDAAEHPAGVVVLGQDVNVAAFTEELPQPVASKIVRTDTVEPHASEADIVAKVEPLVHQQRDTERTRVVDELHGRVFGDFYAVGGLEDTLEAVQVGRVERLVVHRTFDAKGKRCESCGFLVSARPTQCPYCGGRLAEVPLLQHLVARAESQDALVDIVDEDEPKLTEDLEGVGALLRRWTRDGGERPA